MFSPDLSSPTGRVHVSSSTFVKPDSSGTSSKRLRAGTPGERGSATTPTPCVQEQIRSVVGILHSHNNRGKMPTHLSPVDSVTDRVMVSTTICPLGPRWCDRTTAPSLSPLRPRGVILGEVRGRGRILKFYLVDRNIMYFH